MTAYVARRFAIGRDDAAAMRHQLFVDHGTTLKGLMSLHDVDPHDFLDFVHDVDMAALLPDIALAERIKALPGRKLIFTNADARYAQRVLDKRALSGLFDEIHDIHASEYHPKPAPSAYQRLIDNHAIDARRAIFIEDMPANLAPAKALGMQTAWVVTGREWAGGHPSIRPDHVDIMENSLEAVLGAFDRV